MEKIEPGDRVHFTPIKPRYFDEQEGLVVDEVNGGDGYNLLCPLPGDPYRIIRLWRRDGVFSIVQKKDESHSTAIKQNETQRVAPRRALPTEFLIWDLSAEDVARKYHDCATVHDAWNRYVADTGLKPQFDFKDLIKAWTGPKPIRGLRARSAARKAK